MRLPALPPLPRPHARTLVAFAGVLVVIVGGFLWLRDSSLVSVRRVTVTGVSGADAPRVRAALEQAAREVDEAMEAFAFQRALAAIWGFLGVVNRYVDATAPWALAKDPGKRGRLDTVLYTLAEALRCLSVLLAAFLPKTTEQIREILGLGGVPIRLGDVAWGASKPGTTVQKAPALFPRIETTNSPSLTPPSPPRGRG